MLVQSRCLAMLLPLLAATVAAAQVVRDAAEDRADRFDVVEDRTRDVTDDERELMFRLLAETRGAPLAEQRQAARKLVADRRRTMPEFDDRSESEFLVEDLLRSTGFYRGRLVAIDGYARGVEKVQAKQNADGIAHYYKLRLYVEEGDSSPVDVYFLSLPDNWPAGREVIDDVSVVGRFFKLIEYDDEQTGRPAYAPLILAETVTFEPKIQAGRVTLDPALWEDVVRHKKRGWTNAERDLYYRVLQHARDGDYGEQKQQAKESLRRRIERYRADAEAEHGRLTARAERYLESHPEEQGEYQRQLDNAGRQQRRKLIMYRKYRDDPRLFPTYADIVINDHAAYNGQLVTLRGRLRQITRSPVDDKIRYDLGTLYEIWFYTEDSQAHPTVAISTSVPEGLLEKARLEGERLDEPVSVTGYFFKMFVYEAHDTDRFAPLLLAQRFEWHPQPEDKEPLSAVYVLPFVGLVVLGMAYFFWKTRREDRQFRRQLAMGESDTTMPDLDQIDGAASPPAPAFDNIETVEEPHFGARDLRDLEEGR